MKLENLNKGYSNNIFYLSSKKAREEMISKERTQAQMENKEFREIAGKLRNSIIKLDERKIFKQGEVK